MRRAALMAVVFVGFVCFVGGLLTPRANAQGFEDSAIADFQLYPEFGELYESEWNRMVTVPFTSFAYETIFKTGSPFSVVWEPKMTFNVHLWNVGADTDRVIMAICSVTGASTEEAAAMVKKVPVSIFSADSLDKANWVKRRLEVAGAEVYVIH